MGDGMKRVFAFIGSAQVGQSTIAAELAFEWVKRGASACVLTTREQVESMGFDCIAVPGLVPPRAGVQRDLARLATDLSQLEDYDYLILDLPPGSVDLAVAAAFSGAELVMTLNIEQGALGEEISIMFRELARRPPPRPLMLVLNKVHNSQAASDAAERLIANIAKKLKLPVRLTVNLPWDPDLDTLEEPTGLISPALPKPAQVKAIPALVDALDGDTTLDDAAPVAMVFWEQFQTLLQQLQKDETPPLELADRVSGTQTASSSSADSFAGSPLNRTHGTVTNPALTAELARVAAGLEQLTGEVRRLRRGLARKFEFEADGNDPHPGEEGGDPIRLDFESFRRSRSKGGA
jgi:hypothetical protein